MKKALFFASCAILMAAMTVSCGNKNAEEANADSIDTTAIVEDTVATDTVAATTEAAATDVKADKTAMMSAAKEAGQAKCNCYKTDAASVEKCIKSIISEKYAAYQNDEEFKAAMESEYNKCVKEKVNAAAKGAADKAVKAGADALSKKLNGGK